MAAIPAMIVKNRNYLGGIFCCNNSELLFWRYLVIIVMFIDVLGWYGMKWKENEMERFGLNGAKINLLKWDPYVINFIENKWE